MNKLQEIANKVNGKLTNESIVVYYNVSLNDIPPFMCGPFVEEWFGSNESKDIIEYVFEIILANFLINDVMAFGDFNNIGDKDYDFIESTQIYKKYKTMHEHRRNGLNQLIDLYNNNINKELTYIEVLKLLIEVEKIAPNVGIEIVLESYISPLEARHSKRLMIEKFDFENLNNNF